jgi:outer membrane receptor protein involved in Fe transport
MAAHRRRWSITFTIVLATASLALADDTPPATQPATSGTPAASGGDFTNMSLEDLLNVQVVGPAGLTATDVRHLPLDVTELDARDIEHSGAEDLNHLFQDYVPNAEIINHHAPEMNLGFNGIISDREDKYLYQVNGVTLNNRMLFGANDERDLPLMGDINMVDVVTGPASATYGSGALAGVIDVNTYNGLTFQGSDVTVRQGLVDQYTSAEARYGRKLSDTSGLFVYYGYADMSGTDDSYFIGKSYPATNGLPANIAGQPYSGPKDNDGTTAFGAPWQKAFVSYVDGPWELWGRFTQDGSETQPRRDIYTNSKPANDPVDTWTEGRSTENQQVTATARFRKDLSQTWNLDLLQSYDVWVATDQRWGDSPGKPVRVSDENQLFSHAIATWTPCDSQSIAFGTEYSHLWYDDPPDSDSLDSTPVVTQRTWQVDTISFLAEDQWKIDKQWTLFLSARTDKNTFTHWLLSPRGTLVYTPTRDDTIKFIEGKADRRQDDETLWGQWERTGTFASPETLGTTELEYEHKLTKQLKFGANGFLENYNAVGWDPNALEATTLGRFEIAGGELALNYKSDSTRWTFSEGVSTLVHASVPYGSPRPRRESAPRRMGTATNWPSGLPRSPSWRSSTT